jgi:hypothetical protein
MKSLNLLFSGVLSLFISTATLANEAASEARIRALASDAELKQGLTIVFDLMKKSAVTFDAQSQQKKNAIRTATKRYISDLRTSQNANLAKPEILVPYLSISPDDVERLRTITQNMRTRYQRVSQAEIGAAAERSGYTRNGIEYGIGDVDSTYCERIDCDCTGRCNEEYRVAYNNAGFNWFFDQVTDPSPFGMIFGFAEMAAQIHDLGVARLDCLETCDGVDFPNRCSDDLDCPQTQYCKHTFGNPYHSCVEKKIEGQSCSSHSKCLSGCCKYHPLSNPVSMVCRPTSRCD